MANDAQVRILKQKGAKAWNDWREANPAIQLDLSGATLLGMALRGANLNGVDLNRANIIKGYLREAKLREAHLREANLLEADLSGAILIGANLRDANLGGANFSNAILSNANLSSTNLRRANLSRADLSKANLNKADLGTANLTGAYVGGTDFTHCIMEGTRIENVDLSGSKGLDRVEHLGPSSIGIDTIYRSGGNIPESFLRGAGVPEPFIAHIKSIVRGMKRIEFYSCFISYSHEDKAFTRRLHDSLQSRGVRCWLDEHQLLPGDDIYHEVDRGIWLWDKMLLCCSENSLTSWWVDNEVGTAFEKEQEIMRDRGAKVQVLVPLNLDGYLFSDKWNSGYQAQIRRRLAADFTKSGTDSAKFDYEVKRLIQALRADEGAREKPPEGKL